MKIQIGSNEFTLSDRYSSGSVLDANEAKALNVERGERIRNKVQRWISRQGFPEGVLVGEHLERLRSYVAEQNESFAFETRAHTKPKAGTLEAEMREVAREMAETEARASGRGTDQQLIGQIAEELLENPRVETEAAARLEARKAVALAGIADL